MIDTSGDRPSAEAIETAAWFVADEPGWIERTLARCVPGTNGDCAGCGTYRPVRWPCVQVWIARSAQRIIRERAPSPAGHTTAGPDTSTVTAPRDAPEQPKPRVGITTSRAASVALFRPCVPRR